MTDRPPLGLVERRRRARRRSAPPFRRRSRRRPTPSSAALSASSARLFEGLERGGVADALTGASPGRRYAPAAASAAFHLLLALFLFGGLVSLPEAEPRPAVTEVEREPLLYAFEAPPVEELVEAPPAVEVEAEPVPPPPESEAAAEAPAPPPAPEILIPEAQIAMPSTGFQNDLPFSDGEDDEFYFDEPMGEDPEADDPESGSMDGIEDEPALSAEELAALAEAARRMAAAPPDDSLLFPPVDPPSDPAPPVGDSLLDFDAEAFRDRIHDPAADVRRQGDEMAYSRARALAERERRREGVPTDIWRFLEGKRFRNPEGGLVSNRNNTLYYDDRGANLVPWISRLIAEVRRNWYIPYAASYESGHVAIAISVLRSGALEWLQVVVPSGVPGFDNAAVGALRGSQLLPLPDDYPGGNFEIMLVFWYNERPYDLFNR